MNRIIFFVLVTFYSVLPYSYCFARGEQDSYIIICFDDGWQSVYNRAFLWMKEYNQRNKTDIVASVSVITESFRYEKPLRVYLSLNQIRHLQLNDWEILSHTVNHKKLSDLPLDQLEYELYQSLEDFEKAGVSGVDGFVYPYGQGWDRPELVELLRKKYRFARALDDKKSLPIEQAKKDNNPWNISVTVYMKYTTKVPEVLSRLEAAERKGDTIHTILFHDITARENYPAYNRTCKTKFSTFQKLITALDKKGYKFITFSQALDMLQPEMAAGPAQAEKKARADADRRLFY